MISVITGSFAYVFQVQAVSPSNLYPHGMVEIQNVYWNNQTGQITAFLQNFGYPQEIKEFHVNGKLDEQAMIVPNGTLEYNQTCEATLSETYAVMPSNITIGVYSTKGSMFETVTFIAFQMLGLYWNENTQKIQALITDTGSYPEVNFGKVYVNSVADNGAIIKETNDSNVQGRMFNISLSGTYPSKPSTMLLEFTADGLPFDLSSPFSTDMIINSLKWDEKTSEVNFLVYSPYFNLGGEKTVSFDGVYVNGTLDTSPTFNKVYSETYETILSTKFPVAPSTLTIRVMTDYGAFGEEQFTWDSKGNYYESTIPTTNT